MTTPAIATAQKAKIKFRVHKYDHDQAAPSYGHEAAVKMDLDPDRVFKTLVTDAGGTLAVAVVPVSHQLDLKKLAKSLGVKKVAMADIRQVERSTGYVVGGVSPLGQKKRLRTVIDASAGNFKTVFVSAGRRGMEIELSPEDLAGLTKAAFAPIARQDNHT